MRFILKIAAIAVSLTTQAQVQVLQVPPNPAHFLMNEMWNAQLLNAQQELTVVAEATLSGQQGVIARAQTGKFLLAAGSTNLYNAPMTLGSIRVLNPAFAANQQQPLPIGNYQLCIRVLSGETSQEIASSCQEVQVEPMTPLLLFTPYDTEEIETTQPLLGWIRPGPAYLFPGIRYQVKVVEMLKGQSSTEAIKKNNAMMYQADYEPINLVYPGFAEKLDTGKTYAWQVLGSMGNGQLLESEVWTFRLKQPDSLKKELPPVYSYYKLKPEKDAYAGIAVKNLGFIFSEELPNQGLSFKIYDSRQKEVTLDQIELLTHAGDNRFILELNQLGTFQQGAAYMLEVQGRDFKKYYLPFRYFNDVKAIGKKQK